MSINNIISSEIIEKTIKENNYLKEEARNHMTSKEFESTYGLYALEKIEKDKKALEFLFGLLEQNNDSLVYHLEQNKTITPFYGKVTGFRTAQILNINKDTKTWKKYKTPIKEPEAKQIADKIIKSLINVLRSIESNHNAIDIQKILRENELPENQGWLKKHLTILYPNKFMPMLNEDWTHRLFIPLGLKPTKNWFENSKIFADKASDFNINPIDFYHVVLKCAIDKIVPELVASGINPKELGDEANLLVNTSAAWNEMKKPDKNFIKSEEVKQKFEEFLIKKYNLKIKNKLKPSFPKTEENLNIGADEIDHTETVYENEYSKKVIDAKNVIFRGAPGTGKSYLAKQIAADIVSNGHKTNYNELDDSEKACVAFVQFHPSYDYSDFVEGLRPVQNGNTIGFKLEDGTFKKFVDKARRDNQKNYVFIIDEINRGEISKILGELFYSIEPSKRGKDGEIVTQYYNLHKDPTEKFYIPENVFIIGTMNDIDRSVDTFDFAMRRRFRFIEIKANEKIGMLKELPQETKEKAIEKMMALNGAIDQIDYLNSNYHIGAAYFLKLKELKDMTEEEQFKILWTDYLKPLLQEYINGTPSATDDMKKIEDAYFKNQTKGEEELDESFENQ